MGFVLFAPARLSKNSKMKIIIVGAGPSGLTLALLLAKYDIQITLVEAAAVVDSQPRAAMYAAAAVRVLRKAGVLDEVRRDGFLPRDTSFRKLSGENIVRLYNCATSHGEDALTVLPLGQLGKLLVEHCDRHENIQIKWNAKVRDIGQDEKKAWVLMENEVVEGDYLVWNFMTIKTLPASHLRIIYFSDAGQESFMSAILPFRHLRSKCTACGLLSQLSKLSPI